MGKNGARKQMMKQMKQFPATIAAQAHRPVMPQLWAIWNQFKNSPELQRSLFVCIGISILTVTFRWGNDLGTGWGPATIKTICRMIAILVLYLVRNTLLFPFSTELIQEAFKGQVLPTLLNELMRIIFQCTTAYMCGYDHTSTILITFLWCLSSIITILTVLDLSIYDRVLNHSDTRLKETKEQIEKGLENLKQQTIKQFNIYSYYVWLQYIFYLITALNFTLIQSWINTSVLWFTIVRAIHIIIILGLIINVFFIHHSKYLAHQIYNIQMLRFCVTFMITHILFGLFWMYNIQPKLHISMIELNISSFWIGCAGCLSLLTIAMHELKSIIPTMYGGNSDSSNSSEKSEMNENNSDKNTINTDDKNNGKIKSVHENWITIDSPNKSGRKLKVQGNPYVIKPYFPLNNILIELYDHLILLQLESRFSPSFQSACYILLFLFLTPLFLWTQHIVWTLVFFVVPMML